MSLLRRLVVPTYLSQALTRFSCKNNVDRLFSALFLPKNAYRMVSTTTTKFDLMEFFDDKKNWGEGTVRTGRSWTKDELRLKSNTDIHKLW